MNRILPILLAVLLTGCGTLVPKRVEFFQDKVQEFPEHSEYAKELQRKLVQRLEAKSNQTVEAALAEKASTNEIAPAREVKQLARVEAATGRTTQEAVHRFDGRAGGQDDP